jgi:hypothetical protein
MKNQEEKIKEGLSTYLKLQHKKVVYRFDIGADIHLSVGLARKSKRVHKHDKGYPDLFIAEPISDYSGLFLEIKKDEWQVYKKRGGLKKDEHVFKQIDYLIKLQDKGYATAFAFSLDDATEKIEVYLSGDKKQIESKINKPTSLLYTERINNYFKS